MGSYRDTYDRWLGDAEHFWAEAVEHVVWHRRWDRVLDAALAALGSQQRATKR